MRKATELVHVGPAPRIAVEVAGSGPFVLFLHGIGGNRHQWRAQLEALSDRFKVAAWDARGYGDSEDVDGPRRFSDFTGDVVRVLDHLSVDAAHLVGLSMGGRIARDVALRFPASVASLVLANTSPGFDALTEEERRAFIDARAAPLRAGKRPEELAPLLVDRLLHPNASGRARDAASAMMSALRVESYLKTIEASIAEDRGAALEEIAVPTLVVTSDADPLYPRPLAEAMARRVPRATLAVITEAGHLSNLEQPEAFNAVVRAFLEERRFGSTS